jgi:RNA polymerase sigma-70 factor (ECF subfamily)
MSVPRARAKQRMHALTTQDSGPARSFPTLIAPGSPVRMARTRQPHVAPTRRLRREQDRARGATVAERGSAVSLTRTPLRHSNQMRTLDPQSLTQHVDRLYRAAWALCGSREDAEDLVQETFARVLARPRVLSGDDDLYYLMRVLRNTFLTSRRTASRRPVTVATLEDVDAADPRQLGQPERALEMQEVYATIAALPEDRRLALVAVDVLGLSYREAARALRVREATITTRLFRARKQVAKQLGPTPDSLMPVSPEPDSSDLVDASALRHSPSPTVHGNETLPTGVLSSRGTP